MGLRTSAARNGAKPAKLMALYQSAALQSLKNTEIQEWRYSTLHCLTRNISTAVSSEP